MAVRAAVQYMGHYILLQLKLGCYVAASAAAGATSLRVLDISIFDPNGGQLFVEDNDNLITYTGISGDTLTGIPASATGSISATINPYTSASRDLVYRADLMSAYELENLIDRYRKWVDGLHAVADVQRKRFTAPRGWFDTGVSLRDDDDDSFGSITADTISYERGEFEFNAARSEEVLYVAGYAYNPFLSIGNFIRTFQHDDRWQTYLQVGQTAESQKDAGDISKLWFELGAGLDAIGRGEGR